MGTSGLHFCTPPSVTVWCRCNILTDVISLVAIAIEVLEIQLRGTYTLRQITRTDTFNYHTYGGWVMPIVSSVQSEAGWPLHRTDDWLSQSIRLTAKIYVSFHPITPTICLKVKVHHPSVECMSTCPCILWRISIVQLISSVRICGDFEPGIRQLDASGRQDHNIEIPERT